MCTDRLHGRATREGQGLGQVLVEAKHPRDAAGDLGDLEGMGQPGPVVVGLVGDENLGLVLEPPERHRMHDPVAVALITATGRAFGLGDPAAAALPGMAGIGREPGRDRAKRLPAAGDLLLCF